MRFRFICAEKAKFPVAFMCRNVRVSTSGYYAWVKRPESSRTREDRRLSVLTREAYERSQRRYGSPRVHADLRAQGIHISRKRVIRLMQEQGFKGKTRRRFKCTTNSKHDQPVAANLLDRKFEAQRPNQRWVGDTTELVTRSGKLYLAVLLDLFSRYVAGWAISAVNDRHLTIRALDMALRRRCPGAGLLHHSDQGCAYASEVDIDCVLVIVVDFDFAIVLGSMRHARDCNSAERSDSSLETGLPMAVSFLIVLLRSALPEKNKRGRLAHNPDVRPMSSHRSVRSPCL